MLVYRAVPAAAVVRFPEPAPGMRLPGESSGPCLMILFNFVSTLHRTKQHCPLTLMICRTLM